VKIALDAKWYFQGPAGCHTYARNFSDAFLAAAAQHEVLVYARRDHVDPAVDFPAHATLRPILRSNAFVNNRLHLSMLSELDEQDWIVSYYFTPWRSRAKRALIVFDLAFLSHPERFTRLERIYFDRIRNSLADADLVITISEHVARDLRDRGWVRPDQEIILCPCATGPEFRPVAPETIAETRARLDLPRNYALYVGRLNARKNIDRLLQAFAEADLPEDFRLVLVGAPDGKSLDVPGICRDLELEDRVHILGWADFADLPALYAGARFCAYLSLAEGFGIPPLESMSCGRPVLASNTTSVPEVVQRSGLLVDPEDLGAIRRGLEEMSRDDALIDRLASTCAEDAATYSWSRSAETLLRRLESSLVRA
jgi:glycosyltransferase involved in cell wall biosynthesis